jgi:hypothetical protein
MQVGERREEKGKEREKKVGIDSLIVYLYNLRYPGIHPIDYRVYLSNYSIYLYSLIFYLLSFIIQNLPLLIQTSIHVTNTMLQYSQSCKGGGRGGRFDHSTFSNLPALSALAQLAANAR